MLLPYLGAYTWRPMGYIQAAVADAGIFGIPNPY